MSELNTTNERDQYKFPMRLRLAMEHAATVLKNSADYRRRELDEDSQALVRSVLDELDSACTEANLAARAPLPAQGDGKKCQYPNCGCTSRATCNFNYDAAPAQAPLPAKWGGREAAAKWLMNNYQDYVNISELCKAMVAAAPEQAGDALNALLTRIDDAFEIYERHGAICEFEGYPMIYADTLTEIVTLRGEYHAAMSASQDQGDAA